MGWDDGGVGQEETVKAAVSSSETATPLSTSEMSWRANGIVPKLTKFTLVVQPPDGGKKTRRSILDKESQQIAKTVFL